MDNLTIQGAVTGIKSIVEIVKSINDLQNAAEIHIKTGDILKIAITAQEAALSAQANEFAMVKKIDDLEKEIVRLKNWDEDKKRYKMVKPWDSATTPVYSVKESCSLEEPPHWICPNCYNDSKKRFIAPQKKGGVMLSYCCNQCGFEMQSPWRDEVKPKYAE